ncbi:Phytoene desaturase, pro-zeta-carotene producing [Thioalkalivibrio nitratireducens DSM 14787]|uniref:Phytoene desaturase, pro-zeta-carotene producing n=1 Tax=Thioalkalivibrio nitratireducens (strain DSM 14787 / UNIQEM 213 / ALEN2) TaxID=1255043 RepID=L0DW31_THIND|nr:hydroxysqualene dehydroxylase HpnE [Thioalkalivibrio nitratireducens]AGA33185.1 Phytoene desaturase, pro-zeta-carotene producing [Thioalkalivibrio nitratireducens DSM 14787]
MKAAPVAVVGAGWAGLSAALVLAQAGRRVILLEAAAVPGGRARTLRLGDALLDNGQHILVGACREVLAQLRGVGVDPERALLTLPFQLTLREPAGATAERPFYLAPNAATPWSLPAALYRALAPAARSRRLAIVAGAAAMLYAPLRRDVDVFSWLQRHRQPEKLIRTLWEPLCLAVMNAPPHAASAAIFRNTLRLTLLHGSMDARLMIPRMPLGALFPEPAVARLRSLGAKVRMSTRVTAIEPRGDRDYRLHLRGSETLRCTQVILATPPRAARRLLPDAALPEPARAALSALGERAICTVYLRYPEPLGPLPALTGLLGQHGQWLLPRGVSGEPHWAAVVISSAGDFPEAEPGRRWHRVAQELAATFPGLGLPERAHSICERAATFDARPGIDALRPGSDSGRPGLHLAGDYVVPGLPATLEAAVRGGLRAARAALEPDA